MATLINIEAQDCYHTPKTVAKLFAVDRDQVYAWIDSGELKVMNASKSRRAQRKTWRISPESVEAFKRLRGEANERPQSVSRRRKREPFEKHF